MKKQFPTAVAALVVLCFLIGLAPSMIRTTGLIWVNRDSLVGRNGFYFKKRQWLADLRTIVAAFRYLCTSHPASQTNPLSMDDPAQLRPHGTGISTNLLGLDVTESPLPLAGRSLSRAERRMARYRWSSFDRVPLMLALAEFPSNDVAGLRIYRLDAAPPAPEAGTSLLLRLSPRAHETPAWTRSYHPDLTATNLQGV
jgi:hypothetical protein